MSIGTSEDEPVESRLRFKHLASSRDFLLSRARQFRICLLLDVPGSRAADSMGQTRYPLKGIL